MIPAQNGLTISKKEAGLTPKYSVPPSCILFEFEIDKYNNNGRCLSNQDPFAFWRCRLHQLLQWIFQLLHVLQWYLIQIRHFPHRHGGTNRSCPMPLHSDSPDQISSIRVPGESGQQSVQRGPIIGRDRRKKGEGSH